MKKIILLLTIIIASASAFAQVAINTDGSNPNASAMLDVKSIDKGMLVPRMTSAQRTAISSPANGLLVYDTNTQSFWFYQNSAWKELRAGNIPGLSDADGDTKIGVEVTPDEDVIRFYSKNVNSFSMDSMRIEPAGNSAFFGAGTGGLFTDRYNIAIGDSALHNNGSASTDINDSKFNIAIGSMALYNNSRGIYNTAVGSYALSQNTTASSNTALGFASLATNDDGVGNSAAGYQALSANTTGNMNVAVGYDALLNNSTGISNVAIGVDALQANTTRSNLVAVGDSALYHNGENAVYGYDAANNTAVGSKSLFANTTNLI